MPADPRYGRLSDASSNGQPGISNYFGMWDQQLSAYFWNPTLAMIARGTYKDMPATPREGDFVPWQFESPAAVVSPDATITDHAHSTKPVSHKFPLPPNLIFQTLCGLTLHLLGSPLSSNPHLKV